ncbi:MULTISPECIES: nucleoside hydrolase [Zhenhengia]|uniref:Nucleoside hydrolase n=1 Tax=Zhenhengia yiwuensis TaxID=2763666 RepID=A0A926EJF6_9FIRM|nr:nucleoside hydrolase [Zhenhengia yiwuensis]MBC8580694.1 nucleoside hydrolase [Zhenhengia yiwuensis]MDY3368644.1 nucleoside hydrolase [Zhenhengia yiwuensis]
MRKDLIIDCDPGHDDATAIFMALAHSDQYNLRAVTTVCGNNTLEKITKNAHYILSVVKSEVEVAKGPETPLINEPIISAEFHGDSGMDGPTLEVETTSKDSDKSAVELMADILRDAKEKVTILALGPLTNVALLIKAYPQYLHKIERISLMGGGVCHGNITPYAEFNIYVDPEAAQIVFSSGLPIVMCGLDVTEQVEILKEDYEYLRKHSDAGRVFAELMDFYIKGSPAFGATGCVMHDPCAMAYLIDESLFEGKQARVHVDLVGETRGRTVADYESHEANTFVILKAKSNEVANVILKSIESL